MTMSQILLNTPAVEQIIDMALQEDIQTGDVTSESLIDLSATARGHILARHSCILSGGPVAEQVFKKVDPSLSVHLLREDGAEVATDEAVVSIEGPVRSILTAERTALNFMQRMTGIATLTHLFVERVAGYDVAILDTRKTTPALRSFEKYAVCCGGGLNHRMGLYDRILIKDNHRKVWATGKKRGLDEAVRVARAQFPEILLEIEVETPEELAEALKASPDWVLLDNMTPEMLAACVDINQGRAQLEASGGIDLESIDLVKATGIDAVSLGCLTHSAPAADLSLELEE